MVSVNHIQPVQNVVCVYFKNLLKKICAYAHNIYFLIDCQHLTMIRFHIITLLPAPPDQSEGLATGVCSPTQNQGLGSAALQ